MSNPPTKLPTLEEIRTECAKIQAGWTRLEERQRRVNPLERWEPQPANLNRSRRGVDIPNAFS